VVEGLTRLTGTVGICKKIARREVARAAQTLGFEHFFAGPPAEHWKRKKDTARIEAEALARWEHGDDADAADAEADAMVSEMNENGETDGSDLSPDQRVSLQGLADSRENGRLGSPPPIRAANGGEGSGVGGSLFGEDVARSKESPPPGSLRSPPSPPLASLAGGGIRGAGEGRSKRQARCVPSPLAGEG
jgi:hypothetical protein